MQTKLSSKSKFLVAEKIIKYLKFFLIISANVLNFLAKNQEKQ